MRQPRKMRAALAAAAALGFAYPGAATAVADDCTNAQYRTGAAAQLPDCRAWEQVSPVDKGGNDIMNTSAVVTSPDGDRSMFYAAGLFAGAETVTYETTYLGGRGAAGWTTRGVDGPLAIAPGFSIKSTYGLSDDGTKAVMSSTQALSPGAIEGGSNLYIRDLTKPSSFRLVVAIESKLFHERLADFGGQFRYVGGNADLSALTVVSETPLLDSVPDDGRLTTYLWRDGELTVASRTTEGDLLDVSNRLANTTPRRWRPLSEDGTRTWFYASFGPSNEGQRALYQHVAGEGTRLISRSHRTGDDQTVQRGAADVFASADGRSVTFTSSRLPLTNDGLFGIYRWSADDDSLVNLLAPFDPDDGGSGFGPTLLGQSPDARYIWFYTFRPIVAGSVAGGGIYLYALDTQAGALHPIEHLPLDTSVETRFSDNGRHIAFKSFSPLDGPNDNPVCREVGQPGQDGLCGNVYTWSVDRPADPVTCVSCGPQGTERNGPSAGFGFLPTSFDGRDNRAVLNDGRVFFDSAERLAPGDGNSVADVYAYTPGAGVKLMSSGTSGETSSFGDATPDGSSVFFTTADRLVPQDTDVLADLYVARVGGGIASQHATAAAGANDCSGETCRPSVTPPLPRLLDGATPLRAPLIGPSPALRVRTISARALRTAARTGRLLVPVSVTEPGTIRATMTGTIAGKSGRTAARATRKATRATTYRLSLRLTKAARNELRRKGKLRLRLAVDYSEDIKEYRKTVTLTANRATTSKKGGSR